MIKSLYKHQREAATFLINKQHACLFHEVGTGKTNSAIYAVDNLPHGKLLIAAPACVIRGMWCIYDDLPINQDVDILSYEFISFHAREFSQRHYDYVIADECHKLKSIKSKCGKCFRMLTKHCQYVWGLTGTPYVTSFMDIYGIFFALNIKAFDETYDEFMHRVYKCDTIYIAPGKFIYKPVELKPGMMDLLVSRVSEYASVLTADQCLTLPELTVKELLVNNMQTKEYLDCLKGIVTYSDKQDTINKLGCIQKLHQLSNGFIYNPDKTVNCVKYNLKLDLCENIVKMLLEERDKLVIIYEYEYDRKCLKLLLDNAGISNTSELDDFSSMQILLLQEQSAVGINLQNYTNCMIFYTFSYSYLQYTQAVGRIHRSGQTKPCFVYVLINSHTSEGKIWQAVQKAYDMDTTFKSLCMGDE